MIRTVTFAGLVLAGVLFHVPPATAVCTLVLAALADAVRLPQPEVAPVEPVAEAGTRN